MEEYQPGEIVYVIIRNPHAQDVAHVQQAAVIRHPEDPDKLALFSHDNYYPFAEEFAVFSTEEEAEAAYQEAFGDLETGSEFHG
jgi:transcriptional regulator of the spore photoproduct lyase operon